MDRQESKTRIKTWKTLPIPPIPGRRWIEDLVERGKWQLPRRDEWQRQRRDEWQRPKRVTQWVATIKERWVATIRERSDEWLRSERGECNDEPTSLEPRSLNCYGGPFDKVQSALLPFQGPRNSNGGERWIHWQWATEWVPTHQQRGLCNPVLFSSSLGLPHDTSPQCLFLINHCMKNLKIPKR